MGVLHTARRSSNAPTLPLPFYTNLSPPRRVNTQFISNPIVLGSAIWTSNKLFYHETSAQFTKGGTGLIGWLETSFSGLVLPHWDVGFGLEDHPPPTFPVYL